MVSGMTYEHDPRCPAYGKPEWKEVGECGPCEFLAQQEGPAPL